MSAERDGLMHLVTQACRRSKTDHVDVLRYGDDPAVEPETLGRLTWLRT